MADVYPYANLPEDPTTQAGIAWVDDDDPDGTNQTLSYGTDPSDLTESESVSGDLVPESDPDAYRYHVTLYDLDPDTEYYGEIVRDGENVEIQFETFPTGLSDELRICYLSDLHMEAEDAFHSPEYMEPVADKDPHIACVVGDYVTMGDTQDTDKTDEWLRWFCDFVSILNEDGLVPFLSVVGNHEVGNGSWEGTTSESVDPEAGYFQFWYEYPKELDPVGENYGEVTIGDYLQLLALDTHSAYPEDVGNWLEGTIDDTVGVALPMHHSPLFGTGNRRNPEDFNLQANFRDHLAETFDDADNLPFHICGHVHVRSKSVTWTVTDSEPSHDDYEELDSGRYVVEAGDDDINVQRDGVSATVGGEKSGQVEFGEGFRDNRPRIDRWYTDYVSDGEHSSHLVRIEPDGSDYAVTVEQFDENGDTWKMDTHYAEKYATIGDATLGDVSFGY
jgi:hypothetical protein